MCNGIYVMLCYHGSVFHVIKLVYLSSSIWYAYYHQKLCLNYVTSLLQQNKPGHCNKNYFQTMSQTYCNKIDQITATKVMSKLGHKLTTTNVMSKLCHKLTTTK